jgi:hypothetical protein
LQIEQIFESFEHVFFYCPAVYSILEKFYDKYLQPSLHSSTYFTGNFSEKDEENNALMFVLDCLRYNIWEAKLQKKPISFFTIENETISLLSLITDANGKIKSSLLDCPLLYADGDGVTRRGRQHRSP